MTSYPTAALLFSVVLLRSFDFCSDKDEIVECRDSNFGHLGFADKNAQQGKIAGILIDIFVLPGRDHIVVVVGIYYLDGNKRFLVVGKKAVPSLQATSVRIVFVDLQFS